MNLLSVDVSFCRMEREVKCQQIWPVVHRLLNKTPDFPGAESKASVICTILSPLNFVKPVQTRHTESAHRHRHGTIQTPVTGGTKGMTNQSGNDDKQLAGQRVPAER